MPPLTTRTGIHKDTLRAVADVRLAEFRTLTAGGHYAGAMYLGGYAVEALLKCAICKVLDVDALPVIYHVHDLEALLFYSGLWKQLQAEAAVLALFAGIRSVWSEQLRYEDGTAFTASMCQSMDKRLNDPVEGIVPWLKGKL